MGTGGEGRVGADGPALKEEWVVEIVVEEEMGDCRMVGCRSAGFVNSPR